MWSVLGSLERRYINSTYDYYYFVCRPQPISFRLSADLSEHVCVWTFFSDEPLGFLWNSQISSTVHKLLCGCLCSRGVNDLNRVGRNIKPVYVSKTLSPLLLLLLYPNLDLWPLKEEHEKGGFPFSLMKMMAVLSHLSLCLPVYQILLVSFLLLVSELY